MSDHVFRGEFTPGIRSALYRKRMDLGLSYHQLGWILHSDWSTVRNWEQGRIMRCHPINVARIRSFLAGEYDTLTMGAGVPCEEGHQFMRDMPLPLQYCSERLSDAFRICVDDEGLRYQLLVSVDQAISEVVRLLVD